jgi:hypothetical protein
MKPAHTWSAALLFLAGGIGIVAGYALNVTLLFPAIPFDLRLMTLLCLLGAGGGAFWGGLVWWTTGRPWLGIVVSGLLALVAGVSLVWLSAHRERASAHAPRQTEAGVVLALQGSSGRSRRCRLLGRPAGCSGFEVIQAAPGRELGRYPNPVTSTRSADLIDESLRKEAFRIRAPLSNWPDR